MDTTGRRERAGPRALLVEHVDGSRSLVSNETLRQDAPQVLLDFYETRVQFGSRADE